MHPVKSIDLLQEYFLARGYTCETMTLGQSPQSRFVTIRSPGGGYITFSASGLSYPFATVSSREIRTNKLKAYDFAAFLGVTTPATRAVAAAAGYDAAPLQEMLSTYRELIVKPCSSFQSRGLTTNITNLETLRTAIVRVAEIGDVALVQQQVYGEELRFIAIDGAIRSVLLRQKPFVVGDGVSTTAELILKENEARRTIADSAVPYPQLDETLVAGELLNGKQIPVKGKRVELNAKTMIRGGASVYDILSTVHPSYIEIAQRLTERFGKGLTGVDLIIQDYAQPAGPDNYAMLEMNGAISLPMCYSCRDGKHFRIIEDYLGPMLEGEIG